MQSVSSALLLVCLHGGLQLHLASARRISSRSGQSMSASADQLQRQKESRRYTGEEEPVQKCIYGEDLVLQCPEAGQRVGIVTAFWNRRKRTGCQGEDHDFKAGLHCNPNATDQVIEMCRGQAGASCTLPQGYTGCEENPFTFMRVRWHCISESGDITTKTPVEEEEEEIMSKEQGLNAHELPTMPVRVILDESDPEVQKWEKTPDSRLGVSSLQKEHCNGLEVGAWPPVGQKGCEVAAKVHGFGGSSPHFDEDSVCACYFYTPRGIKKLATDCDTIFPNPKSVYKPKAKGSIAIFGKEGCDCHPDPKQPGWTICDLAVREV